MVALADRIASFFSGNDSTTDEGLRDLFISELKRVYYTENHTVEALGKLAKASTTDEVRSEFIQHQNESLIHVKRLEEIFKIIGIRTEGLVSEGINGLIEDVGRIISSTESGSLTRDAGLIIATQPIEHYEIAIYGSLLTLSQVLDFTQSAELLERTLVEEKEADRRLTVLAESFVNSRSKDEEYQHPGSHHASRHSVSDANANVTLGGPLGI